MGDGFLAVFGLHRTRENDAEMAVRAGLDILESARSVAADVAREHHIDGFRVRVGINTGLVVTGGVTEAEDTVMGSAVNLASRIESAAPAGGILISQSTYRQVRGRFDVEAAGTIDAKGFDDPVPVHLVTGERSGTSAATARGLEGVANELVGRHAHLDALTEALKSAATGRAHVVSVIGDAGIGKTRLLDEFEANLSETFPVTVFRARAALGDNDIPHSLLRDLVERCFDIRSDDPVPLVAEKLATGLGARLSGGTELAVKAHVVGRFLGYDMTSVDRLAGVADSSEELRDRAIVHLAEFFRSAAASAVVLMLLDDMHWADDGSLSVLQQLIEELAEDPVLVITLSRPAHRDRPDLDQLPHHRVLALDPLSDEHSAALVDSMLARVEDVPHDLRRMLLEHADGNPYYLEELVMMCVDDGVIDTSDDPWVVKQDNLAELRLPTTLTGVIQARLDGLPPSERTTIQQASIVGRVFWDDALARITGSNRTEAIHAALDSLGERQMIHQRQPSAFSNAAEYAFSHTLVRDATYESVLLGTRREYHAIVADWLIARSGEREQELAGLIAGHLERAHRSAEALSYLTRAAEGALDTHAVSAAADFYDRALALAPQDDLELRYRLLLGREQAFAFQGDRDGQRDALDALEAIVDRLDDPSRQALVAIERTFLFFYTSDFSAALGSARRSVEFAAETDDFALRSRTLSSLGWALHYLGDLTGARLHGLQALSTARRADSERHEATALNLLGMVDLAEGDLTEARTHLTRALDIARREHRTDAAATYLNNLAVSLTMLGDYGAATRHFEETLHLAEERGDRNSAGTAHVNIAWVAAAGGDWELARAHAERGIAMKRRQEHREAEAEAQLWLGHAYVGLEDFTHAEAAYEASLAIRSDLDQTALGLGARAGLAHAALLRRDLAGAVEHAEVVLAALDEGEMLDGTWEPLRIHLAVIETLRATDDERADRVIARAADLLEARAEQIPDPQDRQMFYAIPWHRRIEELKDQTYPG
jgi:tetratricopeptide (TPR) repeat protein